MSLTTKKRTLAQAPTPETGEVTLYVDIADGLLKAKLPDGTGAAVSGGGGGDATLTPAACALFQLGSGTESMLNQAGDVFTGVTVIGDGEYELTLDPAAGISDASRVLVQATVLGSNIGGQERFASYFPDLGSDKITLYVFNAAGAGVSAGRASVTLWYLPEPEEIP